MDTQHLIRFHAVRQATGLRPHTLTRRLQRAGVQYFVDAHDKRQRMIDVRDLPKLTQVEPVTRRERTAA